MGQRPGFPIRKIPRACPARSTPQALSSCLLHLEVLRLLPHFALDSQKPPMALPCSRSTSIQSVFSSENDEFSSAVKPFLWEVSRLLCIMGGAPWGGNPCGVGHSVFEFVITHSMPFWPAAGNDRRYRGFLHSPRRSHAPGGEQHA
jgi:hypothetical protein